MWFCTKELLSFPPPVSRVLQDDRVWRYHNCRQYDVNFTALYLDNDSTWPEEPDPAWNVTRCKEGWVYDRSEVVDTLVTEVGEERKTASDSLKPLSAKAS